MREKLRGFVTPGILTNSIQTKIVTTYGSLED